MAKIKLWLWVLMHVSFSHCQEQGQKNSNSGCGQSCSAVDDCPGRLTCRFGKCADDPIVATLECISSSSCRPFKIQAYDNNTAQCDDCCVPRQNYNYFKCSPPFEATNRAWLYATNFSEGDGGLAQCTQQFYDSREMVVSISTGWFSNGRYCLQPVKIVAGNNRSVVAKIVDQCGSDDGCNAKYDYYPPCRYDSLGGTDGVWRALGVTTDGEQYGGMDITWTFVNLTNPPRLEETMELSKGLPKKVIIGISCGAAALGVFLVLAAAAAGRFGCRRYQADKRNQNLKDSMKLLETGPQQFKFSQLIKATNNFSRKLGEGGFGMVFMGTLADGSEIAVKRMERSSEGVRQFKAEVLSIGSIHHLNLIKLRGYCVHSPLCLLVYDFMPNGSLDKWIFFKGPEHSLSWRTRFDICLDVARGLSYLHDGCSERVLHLDIKPQNILLDDNFRAKISDFGLAKLVDRNKSGVETMMRGTPGYMAPEWLNLRITDKTDVYSLGVVLLETVFCRRATGQFSEQASEIAPLRDEAFQLITMENGARDSLAGAEIDENGDGNVERVMKVALWCLQEEPSARPSMSLVLQMLEGVVEVDEPPRSPQRSLMFSSSKSSSTTLSFSKPSTASSSSKATIFSLDTR